MQIAELIVKTFPNEQVDTYYTPAQNGKKARGKVWDTYKHLRAALISVGILEARPIKKRMEGIKKNV